MLLLLQKSAELFKKHGVKNLTMDDVAKELGMSKKTIYHFVENKDWHIYIHPEILIYHLILLYDIHDFQLHI